MGLWGLLRGRLVGFAERSYVPLLPTTTPMVTRNAREKGHVGSPAVLPGEGVTLRTWGGCFPTVPGVDSGYYCTALPGDMVR